LRTSATRRVAAYERVSSADQRDRETIKTQTDALDARLASEPGIEILARYADDGVSGMRPLADRPDGRRLLAAAEAGQFDELWLYRLDRLGRNLADQAATGRRLEHLGVTVVTLSEGRLTPFMFDLFSVLAQNEHRVFLDRSADGMERAAKEGRYTGGIVPLGYVVTGDRATARLVPDEREVWAGQSAAELVRWIYDRGGLDGWSCPRIAAELNARGVPTSYAAAGRLVQRGGRKERTQGLWRSGRIRNLVVNPIYRGELQHGRRTRKAKREVISAPVEGLVSPALWHAAQATLGANRSIPKNTPRRYLLRGVIHCGIDGLSYCGSQGRGEVGWYRCTGQLVERGVLPGRCWGQSVRTDAIEPIVWEDIEHWLRDPGDALDDLDGRAERAAAGALVEAESITLARAIEALDGQRSQVLALNIRGRLGDSELDIELDRITAERAELEARVAALGPSCGDELTDSAQDLLADVRARLDAGLSIDQRQEIVRLLARVVIHTTTGDDGRKFVRAAVTYRFPGVVQTDTGTRAGLNYTIRQRVIELPPGRYRQKVVVS
jgi:site-specific DNA recombinase